MKSSYLLDTGTSVLKGQLVLLNIKTGYARELRPTDVVQLPDDHICLGPATDPASNKFGEPGAASVTVLQS